MNSLVCGDRTDEGPNPVRCRSVFGVEGGWHFRAHESRIARRGRVEPEPTLSQTKARKPDPGEVRQGIDLLSSKALSISPSRFRSSYPKIDRADQYKSTPDHDIDRKCLLGKIVTQQPWPYDQQGSDQDHQ